MKIGCFRAGVFFKSFPQGSSSWILFPTGSCLAARDFVSCCRIRFLVPPMSKKTFKCLQCGELCLRDPRSKTQRYCPKTECKRASKDQSQQRWASRPENREYFKGGGEYRAGPAVAKRQPRLLEKNEEASEYLRSSRLTDLFYHRVFKPAKSSDVRTGARKNREESLRQHLLSTIALGSSC